MGVTVNSARAPNLCKLVGKFTGGERSAVAPAGYVDHEIRIEDHELRIATAKREKMLTIQQFSWKLLMAM